MACSKQYLSGQSIFRYKSPVLSMLLFQACTYGDFLGHMLKSCLTVFGLKFEASFPVLVYSFDREELSFYLDIELPTAGHMCLGQQFAF